MHHVPDVKLLLGKSEWLLPTLADSLVDAVVTDPPAGIGFMGKAWDSFDLSRRPDDAAELSQTYRDAHPGAPGYGFSQRSIGSTAGQPFIEFLTPILRECLRVVKPGGYMLCWALPRTSHWTGAAIEAAGWVPVDVITHHFGSGFPKHKSKLKPATEFWWLCWKRDVKATPLPGRDACRVGDGGQRMHDLPRGMGYHHGTDNGPCGTSPSPDGRWPANLVLSHHDECFIDGFQDDGTTETWRCHADCPVRIMDEQSGELQSGSGLTPGQRRDDETDYRIKSGRSIGDRGGASRFFYCAKPSRRERDAGLGDLPTQKVDAYDHRPSGTYGERVGLRRDGSERKAVHGKNVHPTVKAVTLMRWLCRLITPPGGVVLDPFLGSGSTGIACVEEHLGFIGIEESPEYHTIAERRIAYAQAKLSPIRTSNNLCRGDVSATKSRNESLGLVEWDEE